MCLNLPRTNFCRRFECGDSEVNARIDTNSIFSTFSKISAGLNSQTT